MTEEDCFQIKDISTLMENRELMTIHLKIDHVKDGLYTIKRNQLNRNYGSVQDKWEELNMEPNLTIREMEYLKAASASKISIQQLNNKLEIDIELEPNEIQYIHILLK